MDGATGKMMACQPFPPPSMFCYSLVLGAHGLQATRVCYFALCCKHWRNTACKLDYDRNGRRVINRKLSQSNLDTLLTVMERVFLHFPSMLSRPLAAWRPEFDSFTKLHLSEEQKRQGLFPFKPKD